MVLYLRVSNYCDCKLMFLLFFSAKTFYRIVISLNYMKFESLNLMYLLEQLKSFNNNSIFNISKNIFLNLFFSLE